MWTIIPVLWVVFPIMLVIAVILLTDKKKKFRGNYEKIKLIDK